MAWTTPRTWSPGETVTAALMNAHVRDNMNILKVAVDNNGFLLTAVKTFAFSSGQGNAAGGADTQLTSYDVTIPAAFLNQPGDDLIVEGVWSMQANTNSKTAKIQVGGGTIVSFLVDAQNVVGHVVPFRLNIRRRTSTTGSVNGISNPGAGNAGVPTNYLVNSALGTVDWTVAQTLKIYAAASAANDIKLTDYAVVSARSLTGATV